MKLLGPQNMVSYNPVITLKMKGKPVGSHGLQVIFERGHQGTPWLNPKKRSFEERDFAVFPGGVPRHLVTRQFFTPQTYLKQQTP